MRSEIFLQKYRILEGLLEKRYEGRKVSSSSVVMEYIRDEDSEPVRVDLDLLREIRNILSHNAASNGDAVVEPAQEMIDRLDTIISYVRKPRNAADFGTPAERIYSASANDLLWNVMRTMQKNGYSHVPIQERGRVVGVFSIKCAFDYLVERQMDGFPRNARIADLGDRISLNRKSGERYMFVPADASIISVRKAFERYTRKNSRLSVVFVTKNGSAEESLVCMLTPWDVLGDEAPTKETDEHERGK